MAKRLGKKKVNRSSLGSSLDDLFPTKIDEKMAENLEETIRTMSANFAMIPIKQIQANPDQPRKDFDQEALQELADSIKVHGVIQPLTLRRFEDGVYQIISGERRWRASQLAGLEKVPAYLRVVNDQELMEMALIENIQREDLNAFEIAVSYYRLKEEFDLIDEQLAERVGKKRSTITNYLGLLDMHPDVINALKTDAISMGHAKAIKGIKDKLLQKELLDKILEKKTSVREAEKMARAYSSQPKKKESAKKQAAVQEEYKEVLQNFKEFFGSGKIRISIDEDGKGQIVIPFTSSDELEHFYKCVEQ